MRLFNALAIGWAMALAMGLILLCLLFPSCAHAKDIDINKLADAIYKAENSKKYPYGILKKYKTTTPRQACINTIKTGLRKWDGKGSFIEFLSYTYAPIGASNDPTGLNKNWVKNVKYYYNKKIKEVKNDKQVPD